MKKEEKDQFIEDLAKKLEASTHFYLTDVSGLTVEQTNRLRALCFRRDIRLQVVKNTLLKKAMEKNSMDYSPLFEVLKGPTAIMFTEVNNAPAKLIQEVRKKAKKPILKGAFVEESFYIGDDQLDALSNVKSKNELIGMLIGQLQSPAKNVISALQSGGGKLAGILKTLSEKE